MKIECFSLMILYFTSVGGASSQFYRAMDRNVKRNNTANKRIQTNFDSIEQKVKERVEKEKIRLKLCGHLQLEDICYGATETNIQPPEKVQPTPPDPTPSTTEQPKTRTDNLSLVFSEPSEYSNDTNCMKFKLPDVSTTGLPLKGAELIVHITNGRRRSDNNKSRRKRRRRKHRKISIKVSLLNPKTRQKKSISRLRFRPNMEKNKKWYRLSLPTSILRSARKKDDNALNLCIECKRCNRNTQIILPLKTNKKRHKFMKIRRQKGKKNKKQKSGKTVKLRKNRPFLVCLIPDRTSFRRRREAVLCSSNSTCCRKQTFIRFSDIGLGNNVAYPDGFYRTECKGSCSHYSSHFNNKTSPSYKQCSPIKFNPLQALLIMDKSMSFLDIPNGQVEQCGCNLN